MLREKMINLLQSFRPGFPVRLWRLTLALIAASSLVIPGMIYVGWLRIPPIAFFNGMAVQEKVKAQSVSTLLPGNDGTLLPLPGTIAQGVVEYPYAKDPDAAGRELINPVRPTIPNLKQGEHVFDTFCQPCHGYNAQGDGTAVGIGRLPAPPSLHSDKVRNWPDGRIFHVLTMGQNRMPSYAHQIEPLDRWAAILYVRTLERALSPKPGDMPTTKTQAGQRGGTR